MTVVLCASQKRGGSSLRGSVKKPACYLASYCGGQQTYSYLQWLSWCIKSHYVGLGARQPITFANPTTGVAHSLL